MMYKGGQIQTKESFLYGRFECMVKPAFGSGVVSSFFTFNDVDFQNNWNEIDFEFLGRHTNSIDTNTIRTINGDTDKNGNVWHQTLNKRSTDVFWKLCIDWSPGLVVWKINDIVIRTQNIVLNKPQKLMMNIWVGAQGWAGEMNAGVLPQTALYKYVRYSEYLINKSKFEFKWQDDFTSLDTNRWYTGLHVQGNTTFVNENVSVVDGNLVLRLI